MYTSPPRPPSPPSGPPSGTRNSRRNDVHPDPPVPASIRTTTRSTNTALPPVANPPPNTAERRRPRRIGITRAVRSNATTLGRTRGAVRWVRAHSVHRADFADDLVPGVADRLAQVFLEPRCQAIAEDAQVLQQPDDGRVLRALCAIFDFDRQPDPQIRHGHR